jgi:hypothetical protein
MTKPKYRLPELEQYKSTWLTKAGYDSLKKQKKIQKLSMAKMIDNLILEKYGELQNTNNKQGQQ